MYAKKNTAMQKPIGVHSKQWDCIQLQLHCRFPPHSCGFYHRICFRCYRILKHSIRNSVKEKRKKTTNPKVPHWNNQLSLLAREIQPKKKEKRKRKNEENNENRQHALDTRYIFRLFNVLTQRDWNLYVFCNLPFLKHRFRKWNHFEIPILKAKLCSLILYLIKAVDLKRPLILMPHTLAQFGIARERHSRMIYSATLS